jgi:hypothetical protein
MALDFPTWAANTTFLPTSGDGPAYWSEGVSNIWRMLPAQQLVSIGAITHGSPIALPATWKQFKLLLARVSLSTANVVALQVSFDGGATYLSATSSYEYQMLYASSAAGRVGPVELGTSAMMCLIANAVAVNNAYGYFDIDIDPGAAGVLGSFQWQSMYCSVAGGSSLVHQMGMGWTGAGRMTHVRAVNSGGGALTGKHYLFGVK